jgi:hypothetical protein
MSLDDHCFTTLILCDIFKAFDRVWNTGLLLKLKAYGIDGKLFKWFESYISSSNQCDHPETYIFCNRLLLAGER